MDFSKLPKIGQKGQAMNLAGLALSFVLALIIFIIGIVLAGQTYEQAEPQLDSISDANVSAAVNNAAINSFEGLDTFGGFWSLIALAIVLVFILGIVFAGLGGFVGGGRGL